MNRASLHDAFLFVFYTSSALPPQKVWRGTPEQVEAWAGDAERTGFLDTPEGSVRVVRWSVSAILREGGKS